MLGKLLQTGKKETKSCVSLQLAIGAAWTMLCPTFKQKEKLKSVTSKIVRFDVAYKIQTAA